MAEAMKPKRSIRRFDVFAEYQRQKEMAKGRLEDEASGHGIWLAKLVASRRFGGAGKSQGDGDSDKQKDKSEELVDGKWRTLDGKAQTDELFREEIIDRMGRDFYREVFEPAIEEAVRAGKKYEEIRDSIRKDWKT